LKHSAVNSAAVAPDQTSPAIEVVDVHKTFDRAVVKALDGLTLTIASGEFVAITGPSGCGKSTLLHLLAALDTPDSGSIHVDGNDLAHLHQPNRYRREAIGIVFQLHNLLPQLTALQNVEIPMVGTHHSHHDQRERARNLLRDTGLAGKEHRRPPELSGGERQRVAIARALANEPRVLLADEPTGNLDSGAVDQVLALLRRIRAERHITIVLVTHDPAVAASADRLIHLRDGRVDLSPTVL
jgi:putative ABC transport system ATP-binding protein